MALVNKFQKLRNEIDDLYKKGKLSIMDRLILKMMIVDAEFSHNAKKGAKYGRKLQ